MAGRDVEQSEKRVALLPKKMTKEGSRLDERKNEVSGVVSPTTASVTASQLLHDLFVMFWIRQPLAWTVGPLSPQRPGCPRGRSVWEQSRVHRLAAGEHEQSTKEINLRETGFDMF